MATGNDLRIPQNFFDNPIIGRHLKCFRIYGLICDENQKSTFWPLARSLFFTFLLFLTAFMLSLFVFQNISNSDIRKPAVMAIGYSSIGIAMLVATFQRKRLIRLIVYIEKDLQILSHNSDPAEEALSQEMFKYSRKLTLILFSGAIIDGTILLADYFYRLISSLNMDSGEGKLLEDFVDSSVILTVYQFHKVSSNIFIGYIWPCLAIVLLGFTFPLWNTFVLSLMCYVTLKIQILGHRMEVMDLRKTSNESTKELTDEERTNLRIEIYRMCVVNQIDIRWFVRELENVIKYPIFLDFLTFSIPICFLLFEIIARDLSQYDSLFDVSAVAIIFFHLWTYNFHSNLITKYFAQLGFSVYSAEWYDFPVPLQKTALLIMIESSKPLFIKAVVVELNLETFTNILRAAYGYLNVIRERSSNADL